jgi:hypothetical protein
MIRAHKRWIAWSGFIAMVSLMGIFAARWVDDPLLKDEVLRISSIALIVSGSSTLCLPIILFFLIKARQEMRRTVENASQLEKGEGSRKGSV